MEKRAKYLNIYIALFNTSCFEESYSGCGPYLVNFHSCMCTVTNSRKKNGTKETYYKVHEKGIMGYLCVCVHLYIQLHTHTHISICWNTCHVYYSQ